MLLHKLTKTNGLIIGFDDKLLIQQISPKTVAVFNKNTYINLKNNCINTIHYLGIHMPFESFNFNNIVISDFIRILPKDIIKLMIKETYRLSKHLYIIYTDGYMNNLCHFLNRKWLSIQQIQNILKEIDLDIITVQSINDIKIFEIIDGRNWLTGYSNKGDELI